MYISCFDLVIILVSFWFFLTLNIAVRGRMKSVAEITHAIY